MEENRRGPNWDYYIMRKYGSGIRKEMKEACVNSLSRAKAVCTISSTLEMIERDENTLLN